ncbi:MAG: glucosamine-6-phosphate deaminase [Bacillota bacterium]
MTLKVFKDKTELSRYIASFLIDHVNRKPESNLGLATGSTFTKVYRMLTEAYIRSQVSFRNVQTFNLDEYVDIDENHPETYRNFMNRHLFDYTDIDKTRTHFPPTDADIDYTEYDDLIARKGGIDIQLLGIGVNGHIGFNEPGVPFDTRTHKVRLAETTRQANKKFFDTLHEVPTHAVTMGIESIMASKRIILAAYGKHKADAVKDMVEGPITEDHPASILQKHKDCLIVLDEAAASKLKISNDY